MTYRARPRYEARIDRPRGEAPSDRRDLSGDARPSSSAPTPEGRWEPGQVLAALQEMHNQPVQSHV